MIPIAADSIPASTDELIAALRRGFESHGVTPQTITAQGSDFPQMAGLKIDLTNAQFTRDSRPAGATSGEGSPLSAAQLALFGEPLYFEKTPVTLKIEA